MITSSEFVKKIDLLLKKNNQTRPALYDAVGIAKNTFPNWTSRDVKIPLDIAYKISQFLGVSINYFLADSDIENEEKKSITPEEMEFIKLFRNASEEKRQAILLLLK